MGAKYCPESPRQKMINMMYLVLTAMLALNVAAETLEAFKLVDESLMKTYSSFTDKNEALITDFQNAYDVNQDKVERWLNDAKEVHALSDSLVTYIVDLKEVLAKEVGSEVIEPDYEIDEKEAFIINNQGDTIIIASQDDLNASPIVMLTKGKGKELQDKIGEYKENLILLAEGSSSLVQIIENSIDVSDPENGEYKLGDEKYRSWASKTFGHSPLIASITLLSKLQIDVRNTESAILRHLYNQIDASSFKFTGLKPTVIPDASYIFQGQEYRSRIFLSAEDTTQALEVFINGSSTPLKIEDNEAIYSITPSEVGTQTYRGEIKYRNPDGDGFNFMTFEREFEVAKPTATVSATKMNVLFTNLQNPIAISVPGVPSNSIEPVCTNGNMYKEGDTWIVEPAELDYTGENTKIIVYADFNGEKRQMYETNYRVMRVPNPVAKVAGITSGGIAREALRIQQLVSADLENFYFDLRFDVVGFSMTVPAGGGMTQTLTSNSFAFTPDMKQVFNQLGAGDKVMIENIQAKIQDDDDAEIRMLSPVILTVQ